jgi:hypothetical protein
LAAYAAFSGGLPLFFSVSNRICATIRRKIMAGMDRSGVDFLF